MAAEIIRPYASIDSTGASTENYALVNETEADDDATQYTVTTPGDLFFCGVYNSKIAALKICARMKSTIADAGILFNLCEAEISGTGKMNMSDVSMATDTVIRANTANTWEDFIITILEDDLSTIENSIQSNFEHGYGHSVCFNTSSQKASSGSKNYSVYLTQLYIEVEYKSGETVAYPIMYSKQFGIWTPVYGAVYKKVEGAWIESTMDSLSTDDNVIVQEL